MLTRESKIKIAAAAYGPALLLALAAAIPGFNYIYSGHGGVAWLLLPFALPLALCVLIVGYRSLRDLFFLPLQSAALKRRLSRR